MLYHYIMINVFEVLMSLMPEKDSFLQYSKKYKRICVSKKINNKNLSVIGVIRGLEKCFKDVCAFEINDEKLHKKYAYICFSSNICFESYGSKSIVINADTKNVYQDKPFEVLKQLRKQIKVKPTHDIPNFVGGLLGLMGHGAVSSIESIPKHHTSKKNTPDMVFKSYRYNIVFDHQTKEVFIFALSEINNDPIDSYKIVRNKINDIEMILYNSLDQETFSIDNVQAIKCDMSDMDYRRSVELAKEEIKKGNIFQVVLSRTFKFKSCISPLNFYSLLRENNFSPYMFYFKIKDFHLVGASPEQLISVNDSKITSKPLAGTRGRVKGQDEKIAQELLNDPKEIAEHMMLVDLARNDTSKVSVPGTVLVQQLKKVEYLEKVIHISSTVEGRLSSDFDLIDALCAAFPAGTLTGAPKIKAMEIINKLERSERGFYGGVVCGITNKDHLLSCIIIRTAKIEKGSIEVRAGAGIVADSNAKNESNETRIKAGSVLQAIKKSIGDKV